MTSFTDDEKMIALTKAIKKIRRVKKTRIGYCYGVSDCWTLFCEYDNFLRNNDSYLKNLFLGYTSQVKWFQTLLELGFNSPEELLNAHGWETIEFEESVVGDMSAFYYSHDKNLWSTGLKISERDWHSSSNLPNLEILKDKFVKKHLHFTLRAIK
jgi:hypothetical protein